MPPLRRANPSANDAPFDLALAAMQPEVTEGRPELRRAALLIEHGQLDAAASFVQQFLGNHPKDADAWFLAGDIARRRGTPSEAEPLFTRAVELAPEFEPAQFHHANVLLEIGKPEEALLRAEQLLEVRPKNPVFRALKAMALELTDDHGEAALLWNGVVQEGAPAEFCVRYSHVLRVLGRRD
jgi:predicted Zn-dependent protease